MMAIFFLFFFCLGEHNGKILLFITDQTLVLEDETGLHEAQLCLYDQSCRKISELDILLVQHEIYRVTSFDE
jgi:hypothetical protein